MKRGNVIAGFVFGGAILALGLAIVFAKDWSWSLFELAYGTLGLQAERSHLRELFISTIGLGICAIGFYLLVSTFRQWRLGRQGKK